jgi:hypothetical protein
MIVELEAGAAVLRRFEPVHEDLRGQSRSVDRPQQDPGGAEAEDSGCRRRRVLIGSSSFAGRDRVPKEVACRGSPVGQWWLLERAVTGRHQ